MYSLFRLMELMGLCLSCIKIEPQSFHKHPFFWNINTGPSLKNPESHLTKLISVAKGISRILNNFSNHLDEKILLNQFPSCSQLLFPIQVAENDICPCSFCLTQEKYKSIIFVWLYKIIWNIYFIFGSCRTNWAKRSVISGAVFVWNKK